MQARWITASTPRRLLLDRHRVAHVPLDELEGGMTRQHVVAEEEQVDDADPVASREQLGHQDGADVAAAARHQHRLPRSSPSQALRATDSRLT